MEDTDNPGLAVQWRRLRAELLRARLDAGLTREQVAEAMNWSQSKLIRIENGTVGISTNDLKAVLDYYNFTDEKRAAEFMALSRAPKPKEKLWWSEYRNAISRQLMQLIEYENAAYVTRNYQDLVVPGLLQTTEYMRASTRRLAPDVTDEQVDAIVEVRSKRQQLLVRADAPLLFFVMDEAVVRRLVGERGAMARQLEQLVEVAKMPNVTVEVIPFSAGLMPGLQAPFVIHEFPDDADDDMLYLENPRGDMVILEDKKEVASYRQDFDLLRQVSLGPEGTVEFLRELVSDLS